MTGRHHVTRTRTKVGLLITGLLAGSVAAVTLAASGQTGSTVQGNQTCSFAIADGVVSPLACVAAPTTAPPTTEPPTATGPSATATTPTVTSSGTELPPYWPDASNTGYPAGTVLHSCPSTVTAGGLYNACKFSGGVIVKANNVVITNSLITGQVIAGDGAETGLSISDTTIDCGCLSTSTQTPPAVAFSNFVLKRDNIMHSGHGVQINDNATVEDSYIHDLGANNSAHKDAIISNGGGHATIRHNNLECAATGCSAAIGLFGDFGQINGWTIDHNLLNTTGSYCLYGGDATAKAYNTAINIVVTDNHFGTKDYAKCGQYGPVAYFDYNAGNVWSGNVWDGGTLAGKAVSP